MNSDGFVDNKSLEMEKLYRSGQTMKQIGTRYGLTRQRVQQILASPKISAADRPLMSELIDRERLEALYTVGRVPIREIGKVFEVSTQTIYRALKFHKIPRRRSLSKDGKYVDIIRLLKIGEAAEIQCAANYSYVVLHKSARCAGTKISLRKLSDGKFNVTRIA